MKKRTAATGLPDAAWLIYLGVGAALVAVYFALPIGDKARALLDVAFGLSAVVAIAAGVFFYRPERRRPWLLYGVGMTFFCIDTLIEAYAVVVHGATEKELAGSDLFDLVAYVVVITALLSLIYSRDGGDRDRTSLIDASIVVVGATMVTWVFFMAPFALDATRPLGDRILEMINPVANLILLAVSVRLAVSRGTQTPAFFLLLMAMLASLIANTLSLEQLRLEGFIDPTAGLNIVGIASTLFAAAAPLHRSMRSLTEVGHHESKLTTARMLLFLIASATGVFIYLIERMRGNEVHVPVLLGGSLLIFLLVLLRLGSLGRAMRRSEERFRSLIQNASDVFAILESDGTFRYISPASERVIGFAPDEMIGRSCLELVHPDYEEVARSYFGDVLTHPRDLYDILLRTRRRSGEGQWLQISSTNLISDPAVGGIVTNFHDVTETKEAEEALRSSEQSSRLLFESSPLPMWVTDLKTLDFLAVNDAAVGHYGYTRDEFLSMKITDIRPEEEVPRLEEEMNNLRAASRTGAVLKSGEWTHRLKDGRFITAEIVSHALDFSGHSASLIVAQDVTERKRVEVEKQDLESQLRQSQKLEAVGQLAGGVAHDFNNLLAVILNYGKFVRDDLDPDGPAHEDVTQVLNAADKAARLVKQLLAFSRREIVKPEIIDLNDIVEEIHRLIARTTKESIKLIVDLGDGLWRTHAPGQMEQVLLNLAVNADAAMPNGGTLAIKTSNKSLSEEAAAQRAELTPGNYVCLSVSDDGIGMSEETIAHIFEPFFTTKGIGEGTGLGLSTVYGIVKQAGGYIYAYSEEGRGTTFNIYLPATDAKDVVEVAPVPEVTSSTGTGSILVVEDEDGVRAITERILTEAGYEVMVARDPLVALEIVKGKRVDLLLTDVIMPGLSGRELAHRFWAARPEARTIFMSGYTDEIIATQGILDEGVTFLQKPFGAEDLLPLVARVLQEDSQPRLRRGPTVLVVDDEKPMRQVLTLLLESHGLTVIGKAEGAEDALGLARECLPDLIVLDQSMPGMSGEELAPRLREASPHSKICVFSGMLEGRPDWADAFLSKEKIGELAPILEGLAVV